MLRAWLKDNHSAILATFVAMQALPFFGGKVKLVLHALGDLLSMIPS